VDNVPDSLSPVERNARPHRFPYPLISRQFMAINSYKMYKLNVMSNLERFEKIRVVYACNICGMIKPKAGMPCVLERPRFAFEKIRER